MFEESNRGSYLSSKNLVRREYSNASEKLFFTMICSDELRFDTRRIAIIIAVMKDDTHELCRQFFSRQGCPARPKPS